MIKANYTDKPLVIDLLTKSFATNKSVNYIIKPGANSLNRVRYLMDYSFEVCFLFGDVFITEDRKACALVLYPDKKKTNFKSVLLDIKLILYSVEIQNIKKILAREGQIKKIQPKGRFYYLWFIGVDPQFQTQGIGTKLLNELLQDSKLKNRLPYLETSTLKNLPWYKKLGFNIYHELDLGYTLYFLRK